MTEPLAAVEGGRGDEPAAGTHGVSEVTARRLAVTVFILVAVAFATGSFFEVLSRSTPQPTTGDWSGGGFWANAVFQAGLFAFPVVGLLILARQPRNRIGWLFMSIGVAWGFGGALSGYYAYGLLANPGALPGTSVAVALDGGSWVPGIGLIGTFLILLFPDGKLPTPRWRWLAWTSAVAMVLAFLATEFAPGSLAGNGFPRLRNPLGIQALRPILDPLKFSIVLIPLCIVACAVAMVRRYRRSKGQERLQMKWFAAAAAIVAVLYLIAMGVSLPYALSPGPDPSWLVIPQFAALFSLALIPVAAGFAILRHRLYDIDVVIKKALVYGTLAAFITAVYVAIVVGIGAAFGRGNHANLGLSILATAVVAVAFQPMRERVQRTANRLVYGERANPYEVLSQFSGDMGHAFDTEDVLPRMAEMVAAGTAAARADVWLRVGPDLVREASWPADSAPLHGATPVVRGEEVSLEGSDAAIPVQHQGDLLGVITVSKARGESVTPAETKLLWDLASQAGLVLRNVRLIEELRTSRQRLITAQDEERRRLERNLHDGAQQRLVAIALALRMAKGMVSPEADPRLGERLEMASDELAQALKELRELARGIHPAILTERGLGPALSSLAERCTVPATVDASGLEGRLPPAVEATAYFVVSEALANVAKYSRATAVTVRAACPDGQLHIDVADDGVGGADAARGSGLRGLADRVAAVDGTLEIDSPAGRGTMLTCRIPVPATPG